jgi:polar amino acid transport system substrate-binding protein
MFISGCKQESPGGNSSRPAGGTLQKLYKEGVLRVGYVVYPPTIIKDPETGELSGYFIDAVRFIAEVSKVRLEFVETTWATFMDGLQSYQFDLSIGATYRTIPRAMEVAFTKPIIYIGNGAIVRNDDGRFTTIEDFDREGIRIAVAQGEASHEYAKIHLEKAELIVVSTADLSEPLTEVLDGRADVGLADSWTTFQFAREYPEVVTDLFADRPYNIMPVGWAVRQNDQEFLNFLNTSIDYLISTGQMREWEKKYNARGLRPKILWEAGE